MEDNKSTVLWTPTEADKTNSQLANYMRWLEKRNGLVLEKYEDLWKWSVEDIEGFWGSIWEYFKIQAVTPYTSVLTNTTMPEARWFEGASLNYVDQVFRHKDLDSPAIIFESEAAGEGQLSWKELEQQVASIAATLTHLGVGKGDRVVAILPNIPETVVAFMAVASIGAIWSVCAPEMGIVSICDRFTQIEPKVLICVDGYRFSGKEFSREEVILESLESLPTVESVIWVPLLSEGVPKDVCDDTKRQHLSWDHALSQPAVLSSTAVPFSHPLWIVYSSGTTGLPKPIVHGHGGMIITSLVGKHLNANLKPGDRYFFLVSTGWIVWNIQIMGLLSGLTICLYDGNPSGPQKELDWSFPWSFVSRHKIKYFGASAAFLATCFKTGVTPRESLDLSNLAVLASTGSPLSPESYAWVYANVKKDVQLISASGGTDIAGTFIEGAPLVPVRQGEMQCRTLGAAVYAFSESGEALENEVGELVCTKPFPSMPLFFWNDTDNERYLESYFGDFMGPDGENIWRHGDWLKLIPREEATAGIIYGRSDSTINRGGIRMGTSELYRAVETLPEITDSMVVDLEYLGRDSYMALFVVMRDPDAELDDELKQSILKRIRKALSARHAPNEIHKVSAIPQTLTGKKLELPIKKLCLGHAVDKVIKRDAIANPDCLDWYINFAATINKKLVTSQV